MFRNIPSDMTHDAFVSWLNGIAPGRYAFSYLRMDFKTNKK